ncbi:MAG: 8-amino-7-oxononanoate synthase [Verrucomicrobiaceae bacterium]|nr:8-amino-7-oxononanoate synthase [Verrucomicrobiaceae bacterium]
MDDVLQPALDERRAQNLYRERKIIASPQGAEVIVGGKKYLNFCNNDYLGLANHPAVIAAFKNAADEYGVGSGASHLVCGHTALHHALEEKLAEFTGRPRALLFSTGYMANLGVVNALLDKSDFVFEDKLNHASLLDAGLLSGARFQRFLHNDLDNLETRLARAVDAENTHARKLIVVDGVFSMDGDCAPLPELAALAKKYDAWLMADDAHGIGVLGERGAGCAEFFNLDQQQLPILMATLGKAFGTFGAFVAGSEVLIETLIQFARPYIYTTAMPAAVAAATLKSLELVIAENWRREHLQQLIKRFRNGAEQIGLQLFSSNTSIQPLLIGAAAEAMRWSDALAARGILIGAIRPPTVPANTARLRITLSAAHSETQIDLLLDALASVHSPR